MRVGVIADTHGLLRPEVFDVFERVDHILHAGDVGRPEILIELEAIAPVTAVYGNSDGSELRARLPQVAEVELDGFAVVVTQDRKSTRLNSSHSQISYAVFCLKKKID